VVGPGAAFGVERLGILSGEWKGKAVKLVWLALGVVMDDKAGKEMLEAKYKDPR
jgi:hypothetical protein